MAHLDPAVRGYFSEATECFMNGGGASGGVLDRYPSSLEQTLPVFRRVTLVVDLSPLFLSPGGASLCLGTIERLGTAARRMYKHTGACDVPGMTS